VLPANSGEIVLRPFEAEQRQQFHLNIAAVGQSTRKSNAIQSGSQRSPVSKYPAPVSSASRIALHYRIHRRMTTDPLIGDGQGRRAFAHLSRWSRCSSKLIE